MIRLIQLVAVVRKEVRQILADRRMMAVLVVAPLIQLLVFGKAVDYEVDDVPAWVVDQDQTAASRTHVGRVLADGTLTRAGETTDPAVALAAMDAGEAAAVIVVPDGFDRDLRRGETAHVQVILDGTDPNRANVAGAAVGRYFGEAALEMAAASGRSPGGVAVSPRVYWNPTLETAMFMVPGVASMVLVVVTTLVTAMGLAREREMGTMEQVLVTPIPSGILLSGKILPYVAIGLFDVALAIGVGGWIFGLPIRGSLVYLVVATLLYLLSTLGVGLLVSTVSATQQQAFMGGFLFMIPAILLSGNMTPVTSMPEWLQPLTWLNPLRFYIEALRANLLEGAGFADLWPQTLALGAYGIVIFGIALFRFRKTTA
jgi:ABC-2 type transport system permease protein